MVAGKGVVPGQPVHKHLVLGQHRHGLQHLLLVGTPHSLGVDDRLGKFGRAGREQEFDDRVRPCGPHGSVNGRSWHGCQQVTEQGNRAPSGYCIGCRMDNQLNAIPHGSRNRFGKARTVVGEYEARCQRAQHMTQFFEIGTDGGIGRGHRAVRHAGVNAAQRQEGVFQVVFAQDGNWPLGVQAAIEQSLANAACASQRLRKINVFPVAGSHSAIGVCQLLAFGHPDALRRFLGPVDQPVCDPVSKGR